MIVLTNLLACAFHGGAHTAHGVFMGRHPAGIHIIQAAFDPFNDRQLTVDELCNRLTGKIRSGAVRMRRQASEIFFTCGEIRSVRSRCCSCLVSPAAAHVHMLAICSSHFWPNRYRSISPARSRIAVFDNTRR